MLAPAGFETEHPDRHTGTVDVSHAQPQQLANCPPEINRCSANVEQSPCALSLGERRNVSGIGTGQRTR